MDMEVKYMVLHDNVEKIALSLESLHSTIATINLGMIMEKVEKQTLDCLASINLCIDEIARTAHESLEMIEDMRSSNEEA